MGVKMETKVWIVVSVKPAMVAMLIVLSISASISMTDAAGQGRDTECDVFASSKNPMPCDTSLGLVCFTDGAASTDATKPDTGTTVSQASGKCFCGGSTTFWHATPGKCEAAAASTTSNKMDSSKTNNNNGTRPNKGARKLPSVSAHVLVIGAALVFFAVNFCTD